MKKLFLVRHAKSSWKNNAISDFERPLNKRGRRDAPFMGKLLAQQGVQPNLIISSPANRTSATAKFFCEEINYSFNEVLLEPKLYLADSDQIMEVLRSIDDRFTQIMLFAHNPGITELSNLLTGHRIDNIPTCGIVSLKLTAESWEDLGSNSCEFIFFEYPKKYF
jgi:phosphohistidine phosphatase